MVADTSGAPVLTADSVRVRRRTQDASAAGCTACSAVDWVKGPEPDEAIGQGYVVAEVARLSRRCNGSRSGWLCRTRWPAACGSSPAGR